MTELGEKALLPAGLRDVLAPEAAHEAAVVERLIGALAGRGYERVKPPLMEFEEGLLSGAGAALTRDTFRLMDPISHRMMALRADTTPQVARIAASRLAGAPRPLRLCYGGQVLRVRGGQLRPERQFGQVGAELIGSELLEADAEVALLAAEALGELGVAGLSLDLTQPLLAKAVAEGLGVEPARWQALRAALDRKDAAEVAEEAGVGAALFLAMLDAAGPAAPALEVLKALDLPAAAEAELARLSRVVELLHAAAPDLVMTIDPVEHRGFEYQTGVCFTLFAGGVRGELGRGGRYLSAFPGAPAEPATGFSLYMDSLLRALPPAEAPAKLFLPAGSDPARAKALRAEGWVTVAGLEAASEPHAEAKRLGCSHLLLDGAVTEVEE